MTLYKASDLARWIGCDPKSIHNWVAQGKITHFRTPGRHLRFRREDVIEFLTQHSRPLPPELVEAAESS